VALEAGAGKKGLRLQPGFERLPQLCAMQTPLTLSATHCAWAGFLMPWQLHTAMVFCFKACEFEDYFTGSSPVSEPAAIAWARTAPSDEPRVGDDACSTVRDELQPFL
jgi:hypothetical protein